MSFVNNKETRLFTQLSEEQQQVVSGGGKKGYADDYKFDDLGLSKTEFVHKDSDLNTFSASDKHGSITSGHLSKDVTKTSGLNVIIG